MLGKLFKYEFKNTYKVMVTIYTVLIALTALGMFVLSRPGVLDSESTATILFTAIYVLTYVFSIFACCIITIVYLTVHFYKTMYSVQGYLTHTLPVKPVTTFHVKVLVSALWILLTLILIVLSIVGLVLALLSPYYSLNLIAYSFNEAKAMFLSSIGMRSSEFVIYAIVAFILASFLSQLRLYLSCSIGQLFHQHKVGASIVAGIIIFFAHNSIATSITNLLNIYKDSVNLMFVDTSWFLLCIDLFTVIIFYVGNIIIIRKHINLE